MSISGRVDSSWSRLMAEEEKSRAAGAGVDVEAIRADRMPMAGRATATREAVKARAALRD